MLLPDAHLLSLVTICYSTSCIQCQSLNYSFLTKASVTFCVEIQQASIVNGVRMIDKYGHSDNTGGATSIMVQ